MKTTLPHLPKPKQDTPKSPTQIVSDKVIVSNKLKTIPLDTMIDKHIGKPGTERRDAFENELKTDLLGHAIKHARDERNLK